MASLILADGTVFTGQSFGASIDADGEVVFNTGMAGYTESLSDPSYRGQILTFTYPLIGNYGVPTEKLNALGFSENFESENIHVRGVVVAQASEEYSHHAAVSSLDHWLQKHKVPGITGIDTRALTKKLREHGVMLGRIVQDLTPRPPLPPTFAQPSHPLRPVGKATVGKWGEGENQVVPIADPNLSNLVAEVSCREPITYEPSPPAPPSPPVPNRYVRAGRGERGSAVEERIPTVVAYDCGIKRNILRSLLKRGVRVVRVPWDFDLSSYDQQYSGVLISNGPGDPKMCTETIASIRQALEKNILTFGICLGNQLLALAVGGDTYKLKYGHRGVNQPCIDLTPRPPLPGGEGGNRFEGRRCIITSQNHGFAVEEKSLPKDWSVWFTNGNDGTVEGIRHVSGRFFSVQFHPEAAPGPEDASYLFDDFVAKLREEITTSPRPVQS